jgi:hypothetical protein
MPNLARDRHAADQDAATPVQAFIDLARSLLDLPHVVWERPVWDVTAWSANRARPIRWRFVTAQGASFAPAFADVVKAVFVYQTQISTLRPATLRGDLMAVRFLYAAVASPSTGLALSFSWDQLTLADWRRAEALACAALPHPATRRLVGLGLQRFAALLEQRGIGRRWHYRHQQPRGRDSHVRHLDDRDAALGKLPPEGAMHALADAAQAPKDDRDRLRFAIVALLVTLGFRISEVLTLPADCLHEDAETGKRYLTYWPEKGGKLVPKWVPTAAGDLVWNAVATILRITEPARQRAAVLDTDPTRLPLLVAHPPSTRCTAEELAPALGIPSAGGVQRLLRRQGIVGERLPGARRHQWRVDSLERALIRLRPAHRYALVLPTGGEQPLGRFLCVVPQHFFGGRPSLLTVQPVMLHHLHNWLGRSRFGDSVFAAYGKRDPDGQLWRLHPHQFRHWINTVAHRGGLNDMELARWMGRRDVRQNRAYQHLTREERVARLKEGVRDGAVAGPITAAFHRLPPLDRDAFLDAAIEAVHTSPYGACVHNFAVKPCAYDLQCLHGCGDFLRTKGAQREIIAITEVKRQAERVLTAAAQAEHDGQPEAAHWVDQQRRLLDGANRALAIDAQADSMDGEQIAVFPGAPSRGDRPRR